MSTIATIFVDGASRGNPGPAGAGVYAYDGTPQHALFQSGFYLGKHTNNVAEYTALALALHLANEDDTVSSSTIYADSELMVKQINRVYRVRNPILMQWYRLIRDLEKKKPFTLSHVRREKNADADRLANSGIDRRSPLPESFKKLLEEYIQY